MSRLIRSPRPATPRRGVTLVEMLVAVALLVLMMTVVVQVLIAATTAVSTQRVFQELDSSLRQLESTIRQDLSNTTARMTPGITSPTENRGYFEYIENSFADLQLEDTDDCLRFTVKAPEGQVFTGRMYLQPATGVGTITSYNTSTFVPPHMPVTITSQYAEVIYFLRAGNLYRRVLLVAPELQNAVVQTTFSAANQFFASAFGTIPVGWQGVNDLSAHPAAESNSSTGTTILLNTLGDLTNRQNRYAGLRFIDDFVQAGTAAGTGGFSPDGVFDDQNNDTVPDYYPSLYPNMLALAAGGTGRSYLNTTFGAITETWPGGFNSQTGRPNASASSMGFPYIYPYAYSRPDKNTVTGSNAGGWIHTPNPNEIVGSGGVTWLSMLNALNHNPVASGDSLLSPVLSGGVTETFFGFPTWRETMSPNWTDPFFGPISLANAGSQSIGLTPLNPSTIPPVTTTVDWLPPMTGQYRDIPQLYADGAGSASKFILTAPLAAVGSLGQQLWEDDLVLTGVRSFDVKAYDDSYPGYVDLGWSNDLRLFSPYFSAATLATATPPNLGLTTTVQYNGPYSTAFTWPPSGPTSQGWNLYTQTFAHEGRIPPMTNDLRYDPFVAQDTNFTQLIFYQDDNASTVRLRRTWDSWSTDYSRAPASGIDSISGQPIGYPYGGLPVYPSFPAPYEAPLRGLQVQIRVVDPRSERVKVLTIRQDFSDKLQ